MIIHINHSETQHVMFLHHSKHQLCFTEVMNNKERASTTAVKHKGFNPGSNSKLGWIPTYDFRLFKNADLVSFTSF